MDLTSLINIKVLIRNWILLVQFIGRKYSYLKSTLGSNVSDIYRSNRLLLTKYILDNENITRTELSEETTLTLASVSKTVKKMVENGLIIENRYVKGKSGRRSIGLKFNYDLYNVIGVKLTRQFFKIVVSNFSGEVLEQKIVNFKDKNQESIIMSLIDDINQLIETNPKIISVGVVVPGPYNSKEGRIELITTLNDFFEVNINDILEKHINLPVFVWHDAKAAAVALHTELKSQYDVENIVYYYLDQGVGSGVIIDNKVINGEIGTAGEIGHISIKFDGKKCGCGNYGCLEKYASSLEFLPNVIDDLDKQMDSSLNSEVNVDLNTIFNHGRKGDKYSLEAVDRLASYIAYGAVNLINAYNPSTLIFDGELLSGKDLYENKVVKTINSRIINKVIEDINFVFLDNKKDHVLLGAIQIAINEIINQESFYEKLYRGEYK